MDYMSKISEIYTELYGETPEGERADDEVTNSIKQNLINPIEDFSTLSRDEITDLIFAGSSCGQAKGFEGGFQYAVALIFESLVC